MKRAAPATAQLEPPDGRRIAPRSCAALSAAIAAMLAGGGIARAGHDDDKLAAARIVFARDHSLWRTDALGKAEPEEIATGVSAAEVTSLTTDPGGTVLLAGAGGAWQWMPLDGSAKALAPVACKAGAPAVLADDGTCVTCANDAGQVRIIRLSTGKKLDVAVPAAGAIVTGTGADHRLLWSDHGVWSAPPTKLDQKVAVAPESPLRSLSIAPDGKRALGVYAGEIWTSHKAKAPAEILFQFALDGTAARRKSVRDGVPLMWSHDSAWVLIQDGASACIARGVGGEYKCWKGYQAVSIAPDGSYALVLGARKDKGSDKDKDKDADKGRHHHDSGSGGEGEDDDDSDADDATASPVGPLSLYRAELAGAFADPPVVVEKIVDGAAVWLP